MRERLKAPLGLMEDALRNSRWLAGEHYSVADIDAYYQDRSGEPASVLTALVTALADPRPHDVDVIDELDRYKGLDPRWHRWDDVVEASQALALRLSGAV